MAFSFSASTSELLRNDLERAYEDMAFGGNYAALIGLMQKEDFGGDAKKVPLKYALGAGQSATAATAYTNATLAGREAFIVTPFTCRGYSVIPLDQAAFTTGDENSVVDLLLDESKTAMDSCKMQFDQALAGDGSGCIFTVAANSGAGPYVLTLSTVTQANRITVGATYVTKATPFAASLATGSITVTDVQPQTKTMTVTANGGWTPTNGHVGGLQGTVAASTANQVWPGIPGWIPPAASRPVATTAFFTVNRAISETKLAGLYLSQAGLGPLEAINQLAYAIADIPGAKPDLCVMSFKTLGRIVAQLQTQRRYVEGSVQGPGISVFYKTVRIAGPMGADSMDLLGSSNWDEDKIAVLDKSTWVIASPGNKPFVPDSVDNSPIMNVPGTGNALAAYRAQAVVYCKAPGFNGMITLS
jgi:hypothetical protein